MKVGDFVRHRNYSPHGPLHHRWTYRVTRVGELDGISWAQIDNYTKRYKLTELQKVSDVEALEFTLLNKHTPFV